MLILKNVIGWITMFKKITSYLLILAMAQVSFAADDAKIIAKIDGKPIYESEVREKLKIYSELNSLGSEGAINYDAMPKEVKDEMVKSVILGDLILKEAKQAKINEREDFKKSLLFAEDQLMQRLYLDQIIKDNITEAKLKEKYKQFSKEQEGKDEYKASHILVKTEDEANQIKQKLDKGGDFNALAKEASLDSSNKESGGSLGYFSNGQMVPAFEKAIAALKVGEISPPVKTEFGYHIIKLEDKRKIKVPSFEEVKAKISEDLTAQFVQDYVVRLQSENKVEFLKD